MWSFALCGNRNGTTAIYALAKYIEIITTQMGNHVRQIEWYHMRVQKITFETPRIHPSL